MCRRYCLICLLPAVFFSPAVGAGKLDSSKLPGLKMYIFEEPANRDAAASNIQTIDNNGAGKRLKMAVFDSGGAADAAQDKPVRKVKIPADEQQAAVVLEEPAGQTPQTPDWQFNTHAGMGYRHDDLKWNIADPSGKPNILSELQWRNVQSAAFTGGMDLIYGGKWLTEIKAGVGQIAAGKNQDSDYSYNNRQGEFSRSNNAANDGITVDVSGALGYHFDLLRRQNKSYWRLTPKLGYAFNNQQFNMTQGNQTLNNPKIFPMPLGSFQGLNSTYEAAWFGPWGGLASLVNFSERFSFEAAVDYHFVDYQGTANWNLRTDFQHPISYTHSGYGEGLVASAIARYRLTPDWILRLSGLFQDWSVQNGKDSTNFTGGAVGTTRLNEVKWRSYGFNLGVEYAF